MADKVLIKKNYSIEDNNDYILVKEFLIVEGKDSNELVLKLVNATNENCRDVKFIVTQLDENGNEIEQSTFESRYMKNNANSEFVPKKAMTISKNCVDIVIDLAFAAFQTAYYFKGELNPITPDMRKNIESKDGNRAVHTKYFSKPILIAFTLIVALCSFIVFMITSIDDFRDSTIKFYYDNIEYSFVSRSDSGGTLQVVGLHENASSITIPDKVGNYDVVSIRDGAFKNKWNINSVNILGDLTIGNSAFSNCTGLSTVSMPNVTYIGNSAFSNCSMLLDVTLNNVEMIQPYAFANCKSLKSFSLNNDSKVVTLSGYILDQCTNLETVYINQEINKLQDYNYIFNNCYNVKNLKIDELGKNTIKMLFGYSISMRNLMLENIEIGVMKEISSSQFADLGSLKSVKIGELSSGRIGDNAFKGCYSLETVNINSNVSTIGASAFESTNITSFNFEGVQTIGSKAFLNSGLESADFSKSNLIRINPSTFENCQYLSSVIMNNEITIIGTNAFKGCANLESVKLSSRTVEISESAFYNCYELSAIELPSTLTKIGTRSFFNCSKLSDVYIPGSVQSISAYAFMSSGLVNLEIGDGVKQIYGSAFSNCNFLEELIIPNSIISIANGAFYNCISLKHVTAPFIGTTINEPTSLYSFFNNTVIQSINLTNCKYLASDCFKNCSSLEEVTILGDITTIPSYAFSGCSSLKSIDLPESITRIESYAFNDCSNLRSFILNENIEYIGSYAFADCLRLWEVFNYSDYNIVAGAQNSAAGYIGNYAIKVHDNEDSIPVVYEIIDSVYYFGYVDGNAYLLEYIPDTTNGEESENEVLEEETEAPALELPSNFLISSDIINVYKIHARSFYNQEIFSVRIPEGVTSIGNEAFGYCEPLELVYLPSTLESVYNNAFDGCETIYEVFNLTGKDLTIGSSDFGYVAENAIVIRTDYDDTPLITYATDQLEYRLDSNTYIAYVIGRGENVKTTLTFPTYLNSGSVTYHSIEIYKGAFSNTNYQSVEFSNLVTVVGDSAFRNCSDLTEVTFLNGCGLEKIGNEAFYNCYDLEIFELTSSAPLKTIGFSAFYNTDLEEIILPYSLSSIGSDAFFNCKLLTLVYNYSNLSISEGNSNYGYVAFYAFDVYASTTSANIIENGNFKFAKKNNIWYLINIDQEEFDDELIKLPDQISSGLSSSTTYRVWTKFYSDDNYYYDLYLPLTCSKIENGINCSIDNVYFKGSASQWNTNNYNHSNKFYYASIYYYGNCVHDYSTWTYVNGKISTARTTLSYSVYQDATCTESGINRGYCPECSYYEDMTISPTGHSFVDSVCSKCGAEKQELTDEIFNSSLFTNASSSPYTCTDGVIKSTNTKSYSSSSLTITANGKMVIEFIYNALLSYGDKVNIYVNGYLEEQTIYSSSYNDFKIELNYGDRLQISFQRGSNDSTSSYLEIKNMTIIYEK